MCFLWQILTFNCTSLHQLCLSRPTRSKVRQNHLQTAAPSIFQNPCCWPHFNSSAHPSRTHWGDGSFACQSLFLPGSVVGPSFELQLQWRPVSDILVELRWACPSMRVGTAVDTTKSALRRKNPKYERCFDRERFFDTLTHSQSVRALRTPLGFRAGQRLIGALNRLKIAVSKQHIF